jgi:outer membrane protein assembly factor BamB
VVVGNVVYAGDMSGKFYALKSDGTLLWSTQVNGAITASALVAGNMVVFGDIAGNMYGITRTNDTIAWTMRPDAHPQTAI